MSNFVNSPDSGRIKLQEEILINLALENVLEVTLQPSSDSTSNSYVYMGNVLRDATLLRSSLVSEIICNRLSAQLNVSSAVSYLVGCYKRLVVKEALVPPAVFTELQRYCLSFVSSLRGFYSFYLFYFYFSCKQQLVSFIASCLDEPEMFDEVSRSSMRDVVSLLTTDSSPVVSRLLHDLVEELEKQQTLGKVYY